MQLSIKKTVRAIGLVLLTISCILIIIFSFFEFSSTPTSLFTNDKIAHSIAYTSLGFSLFLSLVHLPTFMQARKERKSGDRTILFLSHSTRAIFLSTIVGTLFGFIIEILQPLFNRNCVILHIIDT